MLANNPAKKFKHFAGLRQDSAKLINNIKLWKVFGKSKPETRTFNGGLCATNCRKPELYDDDHGDPIKGARLII